MSKSQTELKDYVETHRNAALELTSDRTYQVAATCGERSAQIEVALRHMLCCWVLGEATFEQLKELTDKHAHEHA